MQKIETALGQSVLSVRLGSEGVSPETINQVSRLRGRITAERLTEKGRSGSANAAIVVGGVLAFLLYMSILLHGQAVMNGVLEEKTSRVAEVVLASVKADTLLAGKVLGVAAVGLTQQLAWFVLSAGAVYFVMPFVTHGMAGPAAGTIDTAALAASGANPAALAAVSAFSIPLLITVLAFFLTGFVFYASLFAAGGAMANNNQDAQQAIFPVMMLLVFTILFLQLVIFNPIGPLAVALSWLPFSSPIVMPTRMAMGVVPITSVIGAWIVSILGSAGTVWVAARIYRVGILMYGKRPSLPELVRWVKTS